MVKEITAVFGKAGCKTDGSEYDSLSDRLNDLDLMMKSGVSVDYKLNTLQWISIDNASDKKEFLEWLNGHKQTVVNRAVPLQDAQKFLEWVMTLEQTLPKNEIATVNFPVLSLKAA